MEAGSGYATARANLRDLVKWIAATFAALAAVVLAGTPFSGFGALPVGTDRFFAAVLGLVVFAVFFIVGWTFILSLLRPDFVPRSDLTSRYKVPSDKKEAKETESVRAEVFSKSNDFLPRGLASVDDLERAIETNWTDATCGSASALEQYKQYSLALNQVLEYAAFVRLHQRISASIPCLSFLGAMALAGLVLFSWAASAPSGCNDDSILVRWPSNLISWSDMWK
jgi:hypothetical protein